jgi:PAS domain S-box-containing protein
MTFNRRTIRLVAALLAWAAVAGAQATPRRVLLLYSYEREFAPHYVFAGMFRPELSRASPDPIDFVEISLQQARESRSAAPASLVDELHSRLEGRRFDLVVPIGGPAAQFAQAHRQRLFPQTPMLLAAVDSRFVEKAGLTDNDAAVAVAHDPPQMIESMLQLLPETRTILVVVGASQLDQFWEQELQRTFHRFDDRVTFVWTSGMSYAEILMRASTLPPHSAVFYAILSVDAVGVPQIEERTLNDLHAAANAPMFGVHGTQLGRGIVGGSLLLSEELSRNTAIAALRILRGESPRLVSPPTQRPGAPIYDGRELQRWNIAESRLPRGAEVRFREPTIWQRHRTAILVGAMFAAVQVVVMSGMAVTLARRRRERRGGNAGNGVRALSDVAPAMIWTVGPDGRCTDVNQSWLDFTGRTIDEELGDGWTTIIHPEDRSRAHEIYNAAVVRREPYRAEYRGRRHDGEYRWLLDTGVPTFVSDVFAGYIGSVADITEIKRDGEALSNLSRKLMVTQERERAAIAHELQEHLCQRLTALALQLHHLGDGRAVGLAPGVEELSREFGVLSSEILAISDPLYSRLELLGLAACAASLCQTVSAAHEVTVDFAHRGVPADLSNDVALVLFRVLQEALDHAVKHAAVQRIAVTLRGAGDEIRLEVADDGAGGDHETGRDGEALGLISIRERVRLIDGNYSVESHPGSGTRIRASVPSRPPVTHERGD